MKEAPATRAQTNNQRALRNCLLIFVRQRPEAAKEMQHQDSAACGRQAGEQRGNTVAKQRLGSNLAKAPLVKGSPARLSARSAIGMITNDRRWRLPVAPAMPTPKNRAPFTKR